MFRKIKPTELKPHPLNKFLYGEEDVDMELVKSIKENGLLENLVVKEDGTIISGHRRWRAVMRLYPHSIKTVPCNIVGFMDKNQEERQLIEYNRQRRKTDIQIMNEGKHLESLYKREAQLRQLAGLKQNQKEEDQPSTDGATLRHRENKNKSKKSMKKPSQKVVDNQDVSKDPKVDQDKSPSQETPTSEKPSKKDESGRVSEKVAKDLGISRRTYEKHQKVRDTPLKAKDPEVKKVASKVLDEVKRGEKTVNKAYHEIREVEKRQAEPAHGEEESMDVAFRGVLEKNREATIEKPIKKKTNLFQGISSELDEKIKVLIDCSRNSSKKGRSWTWDDHKLLINVLNNLRDMIE